MSYTDEQKTAFKAMESARHDAEKLRRASQAVQKTIEGLSSLDFDTTALEEELVKIEDARAQARNVRKHAMKAYYSLFPQTADADPFED